MAASLAPEEPKRDVIRQEKPPEPVEEPPLELPVFAPAPPRPRQTIVPTAAERARMAFDCSQSFLDLFERARQVLRHRYPAGRCEDVLEAALEALLDKKDRNRRPKPRKRRRLNPRRSRLIPDEVKHEVWHRDGGRCTFEGKDGSRCRERGGLEFDHIIPYGLGGSSQDAANIRLLCRRHNQTAAEEAFGELAKGRRRI